LAFRRPVANQNGFQLSELHAVSAARTSLLAAKGGVSLEKRNSPQ
jgi:hypothetical protein